MNEHVRAAFEEITAPSFGHEVSYPRKKNGKYEDPKIEDHWQTFQEGWEAGVEYLKNKYNSQYRDTIGDSGFDPR